MKSSNRRQRRFACCRLEPRRLLAAVSFDGGGGDSLWSNPLNWSGDVLPQPGDDVTIDWRPASDAGSVSFNVDAAVRSVRVVTRLGFGPNTLNVDQELRVVADGVVFFSSGVLTGNGKLVVEADGRLSAEIRATGNFNPSGELRLAVDNYGTIDLAGGHDIGPDFRNSGIVTAYEQGPLYGTFTNEAGGTLKSSYTPNSAGSPVEFGVTRAADGTLSATPFVNRGFIYTGTQGIQTGPGVGIDNQFGQPIIVYLDQTPTLGGRWQASWGRLRFTSLANGPAGSAPAVTLDPTFELVDGRLTVGRVNLTARGLADNSALRVIGADAVVSFAQPRTSLQLLQVLAGTVRLGTGGRVLRTTEFAIDTAAGATARLDVGDGFFLDNNQPRYGLSDFPASNPPPPAATPAYAGQTRATIGVDTLTVRAADPASTRGDASVGYALAAGLNSFYASSTFVDDGISEPFDGNDFVFRATLRGDADLNRDVSFSDLLITAKNYGRTLIALGTAGGNFDDPADAAGTVDFADLLLLARNYARTFELPARPAATPATGVRRHAAVQRVGL